MKNFIKNNYRITLICLTIVAVATIGFSFAYAANEDTIYTRDELSNLINQINIKQPELDFMGATATLLSNDNEVTYPAHSSIKIINFLSSDFTTSRSDLYEYLDNGIKVKKNGYYIVNSQSLCSTACTRLWMAFSIYTNNVLSATEGEFKYGGDLGAGPVGVRINFGNTIFINANDIITLRLYNEGLIYCSSISFSLTYIGN